MNKLLDRSDLNQVSGGGGQPGASQFGIATLFWATFVVGLGLAYLQRLQSTDILIDGAVAVSAGFVIGLVVGAIRKQIANCTFWATLLAAFAYMSVAADPIFEPYHRITWALIGATTGALACSVFVKHALLNAIVPAVAAFALIWLYVILMRNRTNVDLQLDFYAAPFIGVAVALFIRILTWLETKQAMPRYVTATWLMVAVILGNSFVPR